MRIYAHTLVKNEEKWIWYSVMSVIDFVDRILIWDTGSTDKTVEIIDEIKKRYPNKVVFREVGDINPQEFTKVRQKMLEETTADWFIVVDGDEIWWEESIRKVAQVISRSSSKTGIESIVVPNILPIGDIFHYQEEAAGKYKLAGKKGHYNLRVVNTEITGLKSDKPHGTWGWVDKDGKMIQDRDPKKILFVDTPYLHTTFLQRSSTHEKDLLVPKRKRKLKYELGISFPYDFYYPEVLFKSKPKIIPSPWINMDKAYFIRAAVQTPFKKIKRRLFHGKTGY
jgi:glycosyltransferase involved in cell wall biosynthesis